MYAYKYKTTVFFCFKAAHEKIKSSVSNNFYISEIKFTYKNKITTTAIARKLF